METRIAGITPVPPKSLQAPVLSLPAPASPCQPYLCPPTASQPSAPQMCCLICKSAMSQLGQDEMLAADLWRSCSRALCLPHSKVPGITVATW